MYVYVSELPSGNLYIQHRFQTELQTSPETQYTSIQSSYQCYRKCRTETAFDCSGFAFSDYYDQCRLRSSNYADPDIQVSQSRYYVADFSITEKGKYHAVHYGVLYLCKLRTCRNVYRSVSYMLFWTLHHCVLCAVLYPPQYWALYYSVPSMNTILYFVTYF